MSGYSAYSVFSGAITIFRVSLSKQIVSTVTGAIPVEAHMHFCFLHSF